MFTTGKAGRARESACQMHIPSAKLDQVLDRFREVEARMSAATDGAEIVRLSREHADLLAVPEVDPSGKHIDWYAAFDVTPRRLSDLGDQLLAFAKVVDFEIFRSELLRALAYSEGPLGGRPPFDPVAMFKILVIQAANNLSDERAEFLINDRLSFMWFLGLSLSDRVPDARTIWLFREKLTKADANKPLFERFDAALRAPAISDRLAAV